MISQQDFQLILQIRGEMYKSKDDIRKRVYLQKDRFIAVIEEMIDSDGQILFVADGYKNGKLLGKRRVKPPNFREEGINAYEWFLQMKYEVEQELAEEESSVGVFATISYKKKIYEFGTPLHAALQIAPAEIHVIEDNWKTRPHFVMRE